MSSTTGQESRSANLDVEQSVTNRYSAASQAAEPALCCPVDYDASYLKVLPQEIIHRDYGCGDPSKYVRKGETLLDLGSGGGKICYIASQVVGPEGSVIGIDMNDDMLELARRYQNEVGARIGWHNVDFRKGRIQDLALDLDRLDEELARAPITNANQWLEAQRTAERLRREEPMIADNSIDVVVSNCVLNLVRKEDRQQLFRELLRVLRHGGRAVISDIVSDEPVPQRLQEDPQLWSGCISGAFVEAEFLEAFAAAGFYGIQIAARQEAPWATIEGIEFRSLTVEAFKGKDGPCLEQKQAVIYRGPWQTVQDDDGNLLRRGVRTAVCAKNFEIYTRAPYQDQIVAIPPYEVVSPDDAVPFECDEPRLRDPRETKGEASVTRLPIADCCSGDSCC